MPIYEYKCRKCGELSEYIQKFSDSPITDCEICGTHEALEKIMSLGSFHLKGSGWYLTDYARKNSPETTPKSSSNTTSTPAKDTKSPEIKTTSSESK
jgi:putative FmdB family regulatory protein